VLFQARKAVFCQFLHPDKSISCNVKKQWENMQAMFLEAKGNLTELKHPCISFFQIKFLILLITIHGASPSGQ